MPEFRVNPLAVYFPTSRKWFYATDGSEFVNAEVMIESEHVKANAYTLVMTARLLTPFLVVIPAILFGLYQIRLKPLFEVAGVWREVQDVGRELKKTCTFVDELKGCERKHRFRLSELEA